MSDHEKCDKCGGLGYDRRTLWMACFYAMDELGIPFTKIGVHGVVLDFLGYEPKTQIPKFKEPPWNHDDLAAAATTRQLFTLRVCKGCRAEWLTAIEAWFRAPPGETSRYNNDGHTYGERDTIPTFLADAERLRTELVALQQRLSVTMEAAMEERKRRDNEDRQTTPKEDDAR